MDAVTATRIGKAIDNRLEAIRKESEKRNNIMENINTQIMHTTEALWCIAGILEAMKNK